MTKNTQEIVEKQQEKIIDKLVANGQLTDLFARSISYLRLSLTDQCNLRCIYCSPGGVSEKIPSSELLSYEEILRFVGLALDLGIRKVRLTGGEPLVRRNVVSFIERLAAFPQLNDIRLTTNGVMLETLADQLFDAGIRKLNISLDTLKRERFQQITGSDFFDLVWSGITKVRGMGFAPIKLNMVALRGVNDDELVDFARLSQEHSLHIRFIEFMPIGKLTIWGNEKYISSEEIRERISVMGQLQEVKSSSLEGPARLYRFVDAPADSGSIGFISPISHKFCDQCNRLRLTSEGRLRSCLLSDDETDVKSILRSGADDDVVKRAIVRTILTKPKGHTILQQDGINCFGQMSRIGG